MKARIAIFSVVAAVGIGFPASHLSADDSKLSIETAQPLDEITISNELDVAQGVEIADPPAVTGPLAEDAEGDTPILTPVDVAAELSEQQGIEEFSVLETSVCNRNADDETVRIVEPADRLDVASREEAVVEVLDASSELPIDDAENLDSDADVPAVEEFETFEAVGEIEAAETKPADPGTSEFAADAELIEDAYWQDDYRPWFEASDVENSDVEIEALPEESTIVEEIVEPASSSAAAEIVEVIEPEVPQVINDVSAEEVATAAPAEAMAPTDVEPTEHLTTDEAAVETKIVDLGEEVVEEDETTMEEAIDQLIEQLTEETSQDVLSVEQPAATLDTEEDVEVVHPTIEEVAGEPTIEDVASEERELNKDSVDVRETDVLATETGSEVVADEVRPPSEPAEAIELTADDDADSIQLDVVVPPEANVDAAEFDAFASSEPQDGDVTVPAVAADELLEVAEPTNEEQAASQRDGVDAITSDLVEDSATARVRTMQLPGWKVTVESEQPIDDHQLLNMLRAAIYQLEAKLN